MSPVERAEYDSVGNVIHDPSAAGHAETPTDITRLPQRLCGHVKLSFLNYADHPAKQALLSAGSVLVNPSIHNVRFKFIKKVVGGDIAGAF